MDNEEYLPYDEVGEVEDEDDTEEEVKDEGDKKLAPLLIIQLIASQRENIHLLHVHICVGNGNNPLNTWRG